MSKPFKMSRAMRYGTVILRALIRAGFPLGNLRLLRHHGRKTGTEYTTPVALVVDGDTEWLVAAFGEVQWVKNIRAAGKAELQRGGKVKTVQFVELDAAESAPILKQFLKSYGLVPFIPPYFNVTADSPLAEFEQEAHHHPVFCCIIEA